MTQLNDSAIATVKHRLDVWHLCWLLEGAQVRCRTCRATQLIGSAPFAHADGCAAAVTHAEHPYEKLRQALELLPQIAMQEVAP